MAVLDKLVIAVTGSLPHEPAQIKKWAVLNGGKWSPELRKDVTHLIASKDAYEKNTHAIQQASKTGAWIVSFDWFEDSLHCKRKLSERKYTWEFLRKQRRRQKQLKRLGTVADGKRFREGCEKARGLTGSGTSNDTVTRKPRKPTGFFFKAESISDTPFVSATEALKRKWAERGLDQEADFRVAEGQAQNPIEIEDDSPTQTLPSASPATILAKSPTKGTKPSSSFLKNTVTPSTAIPEPEAKTPHFKDIYHYYLDSTGFEYKIVLVRSDFSINSYARYHIGLLESHTKPHTYCTIFQYTPPVKKAPESSSGILGNAEAARLTLLATNPVASQDFPYKAFVCPMNSSFAPAWRAFRHVFRDLTLLSWEERFDANNLVQRSRAQQLGIEPYMYAKPAKGLPMGLLPQEDGLFQGSKDGLEIRGDSDDGYVRNSFNLPSISYPLTKHGSIGSYIHRKEDERRREEEEKRRMTEAEEMERKKIAGVQKKKPNYNKPMYNGVTGRPQTDAYDQYNRSVPVGSGRPGGSAFASLITKRKPWAPETYDG
ncbi:hypothetical protein BKA66DRAFT_527683 [Pyrenochaeta sp. MPI-SDFR-AT-0127]|nr:hypothetical protein BKA66DRAFT_527683 [Pyrenochaeta sp. MPI-SDFR-AT-0127]